jgi:NADH dehydrogenase/NADH:ubiquinone oxidoreductase subunit G
VIVAAKPPVQARADGKLRVADVNPNAAGVAAIAGALGLQVVPRSEAARVVVALGDVLDVETAGEVIAIAAHERGVVARAKVALPCAEWAEAAGTITNNKGHVQRMHAAFPPPGQAIAGWEAVVRLASATNVKLAWTHAREVFAQMTSEVSAWKGLAWVREARPLQLRFAGSRG